ncbi:MAG: sigma 54-interacting transcriptional regulator [Deltaproteobacteria bacterium]
MIDDIKATLPHVRRQHPVETVHVQVVGGPDRGQSCVMPDVLRIGTGEDNDLVLHDKTVSRYHVDFVPTDDLIRLVDHGSTNGTWVGGSRIRSGDINPDTVVTIGHTQLRVTRGRPVDVEFYEGDGLEGVVGRSPPMRKLMARLERAAASDASVLVLGESGTGKEVIATAIHQLSGRRDGPIETVDCGSMPANLIASELFGHEKGAFTGADRQYIGAFERADGGTIFLDEIGELPVGLQTNLLGVLERREFRRVGGQERINVDVRVVCATNRDLRARVNEGAFRLDLFYRLAVVSLLLPPLRERRDDIPLLIEHFAREAGLEGAADTIFSREALASFERYSWPGNIRELRNVVEAALVMGDAPELEPSATSEDHAPGTTLEGAYEDLVFETTYGDARARALEIFESLYITRLLERTQGNVSEAARQAQLNRSYLSRLIKRRGIRFRRIVADS